MTSCDFIYLVQPYLPTSWSDEQIKKAEEKRNHRVCAKVQYSDNATSIVSLNRISAPNSKPLDLYVGAKVLAKHKSELPWYKVHNLLV